MKINGLITILLFVLLILLVIANSWKDNIIFTDEILFEEASYQMAQTGDFLTPRLQGKVWLEKPPLYFWFTAPLLRIWSPSPVTRRLLTLITAILTLALTYKLSRTFFKNQEIALWAIIILATAPLFLYFTKTANLDIPATFFITATVYTYLKAKTDHRWLSISALSLGLGILTRSFLSLTPVLLIALDQLFISKTKIQLKYLITALIISLFIALPWHLYVWLKYQQLFVESYLNFNITSHFFSQTPGHPPLPLLKFLFNVFFKFNPLAFLSLFTVLRKNQPHRKTSFLLLWVFIAVIPLSLSATRHEWYTIQSLPPLAILSGAGLFTVKKFLQKKFQNSSWDILRILALSVLIAIPVSVFLALPKEAPVVTVLRMFISKTPDNTPIYNLNHQYIPQSTLFNPRETPIITTDQISTVTKPFYLFLNDEPQFLEAQNVPQSCCKYRIFIRYLDAKIIYIEPQ